MVRQRSALAVRLGLIALTLWSAGCSRPFWRTQADFDSYNLLLEKSSDPRWDVPRLTLESDPRARIYDPFDPDLTPLPPDDATANQYMQWVDGMRGYKSWHKFGQQFSVENPQWKEQFPLVTQDYRMDWTESDDPNYQPPLVPTIENLTLEQAIELANINSRDYQTQLEATYVAALNLTFARFAFNVRYLGLNGLQPTSTLTALDQPSTLDSVQFNNRFGISQLLPSGGQWIVEMANNTLWLFSTPGQTNSQSILTYSLVQPLLSGAGRKVVMENLTLTERTLLYALRNLARFRQTFFGDLVTTGSPGGYLTLLQQAQTVENLRFNLRELRLQLDKLKAVYSQKPKSVYDSLAALPEGFTIPPELESRLIFDPARERLTWNGELFDNEESKLLSLSDDPDYQRAIRTMAARYQTDVITQDLAQLLNSELSTRNNLRSAEAQLLNSIDSYKLLLGLPPDFQITIDRTMLKPFEFIDPRINVLESELQALINNWDDVDVEDPPMSRLREIIVELEEVRQGISSKVIGILKEDLAREEANRPRRLAQLKDPAYREQMMRNVARDRMLLRQAQEAQESLGDDLWSVEAFLMQTAILGLQPSKELRADLMGDLRDLRESLLTLIGGLKVVQVGIRSELIMLQDFDMSMEEATTLAVENRVDLMNYRAAVMDARRNMEVVANKMEGVLNVVTRGDIRTPNGTNPFEFRGDQSTFQAGFQFTAPLDQVLVRNNYRQSIILYQQARRNYMLQEDQIKLAVRQEWRNLKQFRANFETARQNLRYSAIQFDVTVETAFQPTSSGKSAVPTVGSGAQGGGGTNIGLNLLQGLTTVLNAQNALIQLWTSYETNRINIYQDMGIMEIDERGLWVDPVYQTPASNLPTVSEPTDVVPPEPADVNSDNSPVDPPGRQRFETSEVVPVAFEESADHRPHRRERGGFLRLFRRAARSDGDR